MARLVGSARLYEKERHMEVVQLLAAVLPLAFTSGINLYLTVLVLGLAIRMGWITDAPQGLQVLGTLPVLLTAFALYVIGFFADKIQFVDNLWDSIHTIIRPAGAALLAFATVAQLDPSVAVVASLLAGSVSLATHAGKAGTRVAVNTMSPAENISNVALSVGEDVVVAGVSAMTVFAPLLALFVTLLLLGVLAVVVPQSLRWAWLTLTAMFNWLRAPFYQKQDADPLPKADAELFAPRVPTTSVRCGAQVRSEFGERQGYLSLFTGGLGFSYARAVTRQRTAWELDYSQIEHVAVRSEGLLIVLELAFEDKFSRQQKALFVFTRERKQFVEELAVTIRQRTSVRI